MTKEIAEEIALELLGIGAVELRPSDPFLWASGLHAPIYTDNRLIISHPKSRKRVEQALAETVRREFPTVEVIAGTATAGIPHASIVADILDLPMIYVRSSVKDHGKQNAIEGEFAKGAKVVMIEDLISTGGSVIKAAEFVEAAGGEVLGCVAIFNYLLAESEQAFADADYPLVTLTNYKSLVEIATENPELHQYRDTLEQWHKDPIAWSQQFN